VLQTDRREYRRITGHGSIALPLRPNVDKNLGQSAGFKAKAGDVAVAGMIEVQQLMGSSLWKSSSQLHRLSPLKFGLLDMACISGKRSANRRPK
jgi:hypothetical protein